MNDSEALGAVDILVLDALAVAGGIATRDHLFSAVQPMVWGHMADSAARRAGYTGQDEQQLHASGQQALFEDALTHLLSLRVVVPWGDKPDHYALHPTRRVPRSPGGQPYVPGTEHWRNERDTLASELHRRKAVEERRVAGEHARFMQEFAPDRDKLLRVVKRQMRAGQLEDGPRDQVLLELMSLWLDVDELAKAVDLTVDEVVAAIQRAQHPDQPSKARRRGGRKASANTLSDSAADESSDNARAPSGSTAGASETTARSPETTTPQDRHGRVVVVEPPYDDVAEQAKRRSGSGSAAQRHPAHPSRNAPARSG
ncbi:MAG: hypothetical protein JOZ81_30070 [Chloroflexi bacterium]|nr:hypothetical protein [Chloroflexota bacterium]